MATKKTILAKIEEVNSLLTVVNSSDGLAVTYDGGTFPFVVSIKPIEIKNQFVYIINDGGTYTDGKERYNLNKKSLFGDDYDIQHLNYTLSVILKAFKQLINSNK